MLLKDHNTKIIGMQTIVPEVSVAATQSVWENVRVAAQTAVEINCAYAQT
jgi:hypothetical protein